jgi:hypothetical protein
MGDSAQHGGQTARWLIVGRHLASSFCLSSHGLMNGHHIAACAQRRFTLFVDGRIVRPHRRPGIWREA